jgi:hypothetical protein
MPTLKKRAVSRRAAPRKRVAKAAKVAKVSKTLKPEKISRAEVTFFEQKAEAYRSSEEKWQRLSAAPEEDRWSAVEDHLLARADQSQGKDWKYFAK